MKISSLTNPRIKRVVKLKQRKGRDEEGLTVVDGLRETSRAREAGIPFEELYLCPELLEKFAGPQALAQVRAWGATADEVSKEVFAKISFGDRHEGVAAVIRSRSFPLDASRLLKNPLVVVVEHVEKPGNLGAILRSCDGAGVDAVIVADTQTDLWNPNVIRASTGIVFSMMLMQADGKQVKEFLDKQGIRVLAAAPQGGQDYFSVDLKGALALVVGAEDEGLSDFWLSSDALRISIPMRGRADSLNVSNTAAILAYEALRQRRSV